MEIAVIITVLVLAVLSLTTSSFAWLPSRKDEEEEETASTLPPLSVIVMVHDDIDNVERNIDILLGQEYEPGYEVILVSNEKDSVADDLMKKHNGNSRLRSTFIPNTSRYVSRDKLGVTLGVKAASNEWCLLMDGNSMPLTNRWLYEMGKACSEDINIVIGPANYDLDAHRYQRFTRLRHFCQLWRISRFSTVFAANQSNLCFRKSEFIGNDGFRGNLEIIRGEYDFIVNKYAKRGTTAFVTTPDAILKETAPTRKQWNNRRKYFLYSCKTLKRKFANNLIPNIDAVMLHTAFIASVATIVLGSLTQQWFILGAGVAALLIEMLGRTLIASKTINKFNAEIPAWTVFVLELTSIYRTLADKMRTRFSSKYDFTCHKL